MFLLNLQSKIPIYEQIQAQIIRFIEAGVLNPGDKLPSVRQLAQDNGIDAQALAATAEDYRVKAGNGEEIEAAEFALSAEMATPLETAPYYVEKVTVRTFGTIPGLEINEKCQIITAQGETVPGLYGSGELVAGNAFTRQYPGIGIGISFAGNSGRFAVSQILEDLK